MRVLATGLLVAVVGVIVLTAPAQTKSKRGEPDERLPQQIRAGHVQRYAEWLNLSHAQSYAVSRDYLEYLRRYQSLEPLISAYFSRPPQTSPSDSDAIAWLREDVRLNEDLRNRIRMLDEQFFASIQAILADEQLPAMQRVRDQRRRQVAQIGRFMQLTGRPTADLGDLLEAFEVDPEQQATVDSIIRSNEHSLTVLLVKLDPLARSWFLDLMIALQARGIAGDAPRELYLPVAAEILEPALRMAMEVDALNDRTCAKIREALPAVDQGAWQEYVILRVHPHLGGFAEYLVRVKKSAAALRPETEEDKALIAAAVDELVRRTDPWLTKLVESNIAQQVRHNPYDSNLELAKAHQSLQKEASQDTQAAIEALQARLETALGAAAVQRFKNGLERDEDRLPGSFVAASLAPPSLRLESLQIARPDFERWLELLTPAESQRTSIEVAFSEYQRGIIEETAAESKSRVKWLAAESSITAVRGLDERLFDEMAAALGDSNSSQVLNVIRDARSRWLIRSSIIKSQWAASQDVGRVVLDAGLSLQEIALIAPAVQGYDEQILASLNEWARASRLYEQITDDWDYDTQVMPVYQTINKESANVARINRSTLDVLISQLNSESARALRDRFNRACFPELFRDPNAAAEVFRQARNLETLTADRMQSLDELELNYRTRYAEATQQIIDAIGDTVFWTTDRQGRRRPACRDCVAAFNRWKLEREELNALARLQISALLTVQQAQQLGNLLRISVATAP